MRLDNSSFERIMMFVSKNTLVHETIARVRTENTAEIERFKTHILQNTLTPEDTLFDDPNCEAYALSLLKSNEIPKQKAYCLLNYLEFLKQYTNRQSLKSEDYNVFKNLDIKFTLATEDENQKMRFLLAAQLAAFGLPHVTPMALDGLWHQLSGCERWTFLMDIRPEQLKSGTRTGFGTNFNFLIRALQGFPWIVSDEHYQYYFYPSFSFFLKLASLINPDYHLEAQPIFGRIKESTLTQLISDGFRPITQYSNYIKNNPDSQHGSTCGPVVFKLHDYWHLISAALILQKDAHDLLFHTIVPALGAIHTHEAELSSNFIGDLNIADLIPKDEMGKWKTNNDIFLTIRPSDFLFFALFTHPRAYDPLILFTQLYATCYPCNKEFNCLGNVTINTWLDTIAKIFFPNLCQVSQLGITCFIYALKFIMALEDPERTSPTVLQTYIRHAIEKTPVPLLDFIRQEHPPMQDRTAKAAYIQAML